MPRIRRASVFWPVVLVLLLLVAACSSGENGTSTATAPGTSEAPAPTEIGVDASGVMNRELDLSFLPDDPTELMMASLEEPLDRVARKMAYSGNQTYIPVLLEYLRFQAEEGGVIKMTFFLSRLKDNVPPEELMLFNQEQTEWKWWIEWLGNNPQVQPPDGYVGWKGQLYSILDPGLGHFCTTELRPIAGSKRWSGAAWPRTASQT